MLLCGKELSCASERDCVWEAGIDCSKEGPSGVGLALGGQSKSSCPWPSLQGMACSIPGKLQSMRKDTAGVLVAIGRPSM